MRDLYLQVRGLNAYYGTSHILQGVSLEVGQECVAVLGRNGAGKTTLLRSILGLTPPTCKGNISFQGTEILSMEPNEVAFRGLGYVPQGRRLFPSLSVHEHLDLFHRNRQGKQDWSPEAIYELFPLLRKRLNISGARLSGGEQQMLAIGRALVTNPSLLVMDEPSEGLSPVVIRQLNEVFRELINTGIALLLVEQKLNVTDEIANRVYLMVNGRIVHRAPGKEFARDTDSRKRYLGV